MALNAVQQYVENQTSGAVTEPVNGSWLAAYALYLGITEPSNESWLQAICEYEGVTTPTYGSWLIALANHYGITTPYPYGSWWIALANYSPSPVVPMVWNLNTNLWNLETRTY